MKHPQHKTISAIAGAAILSSVCMLAVPAAAQSPTDVLKVGLGDVSHGILAPSQVDILTSFFETQIATFPAPESSAPFVYVEQPNGQKILKAYSFGPVFAERVETSGRHTLNMTVTTQVLRWRRLDDLDLHQIELRNDAATGSLTRQSHASVDLTSLSTIASVTYGVTNRYDVSLIAPFVHTDVATHIEGLTGGGDATSSHSAASRLVLGDVGLRLKAAVIAGSSTGLSVFGKLQAPTARPSDLSGSGRWAEQVGIIAAVRAAGTNVTANAGRRWAGRGIVFEDVTVFGQSFLAVKAVEPSSEWDYNVSVDRPVTTRITVVGELVGRVLDHGARFRVVTRDSPLFGVTSSLEVLPRANQSLLLGSVGAKVQIHSDLLLTVSSTIPISSSGLQSRVAPVVGIAKVF